jgi:hypothetical protein
MSLAGKARRTKEHNVEEWFHASCAQRIIKHSGNFILGQPGIET